MLAICHAPDMLVKAGVGGDKQIQIQRRLCIHGFIDSRAAIEQYLDVCLTTPGGGTVSRVALEQRPDIKQALLIILRPARDEDAPVRSKFNKTLASQPPQRVAYRGATDPTLRGQLALFQVLALRKVSPQNPLPDPLVGELCSTFFLVRFIHGIKAPSRVESRTNNTMGRPVAGPLLERVQ